jgi:hypothetical protein
LEIPIKSMFGVKGFARYLRSLSGCARMPGKVDRKRLRRSIDIVVIAYASERRDGSAQRVIITPPAPTSVTVRRRRGAEVANHFAKRFKTLLRPWFGCKVGRKNRSPQHQRHPSVLRE